MADGPRSLRRPILVIRMHIRFGASESEILHLEGEGHETLQDTVQSFTPPDREDSRLREPLRQALDDGIHRLIVDLGDVIVLNSIGLAELIDWHNMIGKYDGAMVLCGVGGRVAQTLQVTKLDAVFTMVPDMEAAQVRIREMRPL